jgi:cob(I)alamin adenosyltransferase
MEDTLRKIYTKGGDKGRTRLLSGETVEKDACRVGAYGALDELQSHLGMARVLTRHEPVRSILCAVQRSLFVAGAELASTHDKLPRLERRINPEDVRGVEKWIDGLTKVYGLPGHFVVPGRSLDSAALHVARAVCRRCERSIVSLNREASGEYSECIVYFNRLSDLLFVLAWCLELRAVVEEVLRGLSTETFREGKRP